MVAIGCALSACRHSVVWLGDASRAAGASAFAADGGSPRARDAGASEPDAAPPVPDDTQRTGVTAQPASTPSDAGAPPAADGGMGTLSGPRLPVTPSGCPSFQSGLQHFGNFDVQIRAGTAVPGKPGPLLIYWHGTGSNPDEINSMLHMALDEIIAEGGVIAAPVTTTGEGHDTGTGTWYTGDLDAIDKLVGCAAGAQLMDFERIYTAGCSWGAVQAGVMALKRSQYVAAAMLSSGGEVDTYALSEPQHVPAVITAHGPSKIDVVIVDFAMTSQRLTQDVAAEGGFAVDCEHSGGHCGAPAELVNAQWQFLKAHPFSVKQSPYLTGLPASFPKYCKIARK